MLKTAKVMAANKETGFPNVQEAGNGCICYEQ